LTVRDDRKRDKSSPLKGNEAAKVKRVEVNAFGQERLHGAIARRLGTAIMCGEYKPGDTLDNEIAFSEALNVSRSAFREAIRILAAKGLVESRPKAGTQVSPRSRWNLLDPAVLAWAFANEPSQEFIRDIFELRAIVEPAAAALAAERRTGEDIAAMREALVEMQRHGLGIEEGRTADRAFHHAVLAATRNAPLITLSSSIGASVRWTTIFKQRDRELPRDPMPEHWRVFDSIAAGNPDDARAAMRELIAFALEDTRVSFDR
jgi:DNA-binding FadR family transcriptional regulator